MAPVLVTLNDLEGPDNGYPDMQTLDTKNMPTLATVTERDFCSSDTQLQFSESVAIETQDWWILRSRCHPPTTAERMCDCSSGATVTDFSVIFCNQHSFSRLENCQYSPNIQERQWMWQGKLSTSVSYISTLQDHGKYNECCMSKFLEASNFPCKEQHGFTNSRSCLINLLETLENWTRALDEGCRLDVVYLDYRKAFDSVPHCRLLEKLKAFEISGKLLLCLVDFLISRTMKVGIRCTFSELLTVLSARQHVRTLALSVVCQWTTVLDNQRYENVCRRYKALVQDKQEAQLSLRDRASALSVEIW